MTEREFIDSLPRATECDVCGAHLDDIRWQVGKYGREWFGLGVVKCEPCSWVRIAAAGSDDLSHSFARSQRVKAMKAMGIIFH